jgi:hypothetical protein
MSIIFNEKNHSYTSKEPDNISWISVTTLISKFKEKFNSDEIAIKSSKNKKSKWYGLTPEEIQKLWKKETDRALKLGTYYHNQREADLCSLSSITLEGVTLPVYTPIVLESGVKEAPDQKLTDGIYPEHMVYLKSAGICGQSDLVEVVNGKINIIDYKSNKKIDTVSYTNWEGISKKMLAPLNHLDDCNFNHYNIQLSIYMYIMLKHNPKLKPGKMCIHHIIFEEEGRDEYDYPITKLDSEGNPVVKEIIPMEMPYLKSEVISIINYLKTQND